MSYDHKNIDAKWQARWEKEKTFHAEDFSEKPKFYCLVEFPYPSGAGLHMGHPRSYTALDVVARKRRMEGFNVLYPIGWDAFGLPTENYAIKTGQKPQEVTHQNVATFKRQLQSLGLSFDWSREINTTDPAYYKWTQWMFLQFYKAGLAYKKKMPINWCPACKIGLANEEVMGGACERCGAVVEKREKEQWMIAITKYADRLLLDLTSVDYLEKIKKQQEDWIGKSEGAEIKFAIEGTHESVTVFTTRPDTLFGATFLVLAPEHPLVATLTTRDRHGEVFSYIKKAAAITSVDRADETREKTGVFIGAYAIHPATGEQIPIWTADYVMMEYGTGAIMAVPAHDERDFAFATKFDLPITQVIEAPQKKIALLLHGTGGNGRDSWFPWISEKLTALGYKVIAPDMPDPTKPDLQKWLHVLEKYQNEINENSIIIGRSLGCPIAFQFLQKINKKIYQLVMVAPTHADMDWEGYKKKFPEFGVEFVQTIAQAKTDWQKIQNLTDKVTLFFSDDDPRIPLQVKDYYQRDLRADIIVLHGKGHFGTSAGVLKFPEAMDAIVENFSDTKINTPDLAYVADGVVINSGEFDGLTTKEAKMKIISWVEEKGIGKAITHYKLRDWVFSRQRYWGEPIPLVHCPVCGWVPVPESDLPVVLPEVENYQPTDSGESPLAAMTDWVNTTCPKCGAKAKRETDTMPNWAGSSWYFLRYCDPRNNEAFADQKKLAYWMPTDWYNGGMEHTTLHLLYSRFWNKFLYDQGFVPTSEPYQKRTSHGLVLAQDGSKMSKSKGNVVNPDQLVVEYGADVLRVYEMFMGPFGEPVPWNEQGVIGVRRFLEKVERLREKIGEVDDEAVIRCLHQTIKKVTDDIEAMRFNTAVSQLMIFVNTALEKEKISKATFISFLTMLCPFAPHLANELHESLGETTLLETLSWPIANAELAKESELEIAIQVNGKLRASILVACGTEESAIVEQAKEVVAKHLTSEIKKTIYVRGRLVNFVV
ncbi:MAG: alpha/beta fold hydrolase [Patescibacteria group bacterium]|jgi:leucyl-tRNA synthetase